MLNFCRLLSAFILISVNAFAYSGPRGLYVLEYPVNMPNVSLISEYNQQVPILRTSADLTIMIFWSQKCAPCLREMKDLEALYPKASEDNINLMLVAPAAEWQSRQEERKFLTKYGAPTIPFYNDLNNKLSLSLGIGSTPYTVIMDKNGKKVATIQGAADWSSSKLYKQIKDLIKETSPQTNTAQIDFSTTPATKNYDNKVSAKTTTGTVAKAHKRPLPVVVVTH